ncbi:hypothetical protein AVDCRST_MAG94-2410 [uncultured Leptolyngbya sp.]|uniref:Uncharacterized protein n=1 Tax=uncultured Leptolyngbya sp. TaxID=332963 RepID=A0A6J4LX10_9CYAN|nr:hypothetical protein AVDCRST_MAG94-2410 [uncultured Leptolyngbya sp.]
MELPVVKVKVLEGEIVPGQPKRGLSPNAVSEAADFRWARVEEFLRSRELTANTHKAYARELRRFLSWTPKGWQEVTHRKLDHYKEYIRSPHPKATHPPPPLSIEPWRRCKASSS